MKYTQCLDSEVDLINKRNGQRQCHCATQNFLTLLRRTLRTDSEPYTLENVQKFTKYDFLKVCSDLHLFARHL